MFERQGLPDIFESFDARRVLTGNSLILQFSQPVTRKQRHRHLTTRSFVVSLDGADLGLEAGMQSTGFPQLPSDFLDGLGNNYLVIMDGFVVVVQVILVMNLSGQMALVRIGNRPFANRAGGARIGSHVYTPQSAHLMACVADPLPVEVFDWSDPLFTRPLRPDAGGRVPVEGPGFGVTLDRGALERHGELVVATPGGS